MGYDQQGNTLHKAQWSRSSVSQHFTSRWNSAWRADGIDSISKRKALVSR
jgi:hypothetical protein